MHLVDLALDYLLARHGVDLEVKRLVLYLPSELHSIGAGDLRCEPGFGLPFRYSLLRGALEAATGADALLYWGDFLHSRHYRTAVARLLVNASIAPNSDAALEIVDRHFFLSSSADAVLQKTLLFGQGLLTDDGTSPLDDRYSALTGRLFAKAHRVWMRDALSANRAAQLRAAVTESCLGMDCALLLEEADFVDLSRAAPRTPTSGPRAGIFFARTKIPSAQLLGLAGALCKRFAAAPEWIPWFAEGALDLDVVRPFIPEVSRPRAPLADLLAAVRRCTFIVTDAYHLCLTAWSLGVPAVCVGRGAAQFRTSLSDKKKEIFYSMYGAERLYVFAEQLGAESAASLPDSGPLDLDQLARDIADKHIAARVQARIAVQRGQIGAELIGALRGVIDNHRVSGRTRVTRWVRKGGARVARLLATAARAVESAAPPVISTTVLNWNRADLLERTLETYVATVTVPYEIFIVDNASTDRSRRVIEDFCARYRTTATAIVCETNLGGEALNLGLSRSRGRLFHLSENDLEYLPGWCDRVLDCFDTFEDLGQLSVFGPVPTDEEAWELKPCVLRHARGRIIYEAEGNVGTSSVIRRELWEKGLRVRNLVGPGVFKFPADATLSADVKALGFRVAWSDHYLVRNTGHAAREMQSRASYYRDNYASKPWLGISGLEQRLAAWQGRPRPMRSSLVLPSERTSPDKTAASQACPEPQLWSMFDGWSAEVETVDFLHALVRLIKPRFAVETGAWQGMAAAAIGTALAANGRGFLVSLEIDADSCEAARRRLRANKLHAWARLEHRAPLDHRPDRAIDPLLLNAAPEMRTAEFRHFRSFLAPRCVVVLQDTARHHGVAPQAVDELLTQGGLRALQLATPRGVAVCQLSADNVGGS